MMNLSVNNPDNDEQTLINAANNGDMYTVQELIEKGVNVNVQNSDDGHTALMEACRWGHHPIAELLINAGANIDQKNTRGWTPLMFCAANGRQETAQLLIENGVDIEAKNNQGENALIIGRFCQSDLLVQGLKSILNKRDKVIRRLQTGNVKEAIASFNNEPYLMPPKMQDKIISEVLKERCRERNSAIITAGYRQTIKNLAEEHALRQLIPHDQEKKREQLREALEGAGIDVKSIIAALGDAAPDLSDVKKILRESLESQQVEKPKGFFSRILRIVADILFGTTNQSELELRIKLVDKAQNVESAFGVLKGLTIAQPDSQMMPLESPEAPLTKRSPEEGIKKSSSVLRFSNADNSDRSCREKPKK